MANIKRKIAFRYVLLGLGLAGLGACSRAAPPSTDSGAARAAVSAEKPLRIVTTIGMIADAAEKVGGPYVKVTGLMGPGVDPHLYKASEGDIQRLAQADLILYNGLNLEGKMGDIFVKMARTRPTIAVTEDVDAKRLREPPEFQGHYDPHLWFDVELWTGAVHRIARGLAEFDPAHAKEYQANAEHYIAELMTLHTWCGEQIAQIPKGQRVLITAHDAFGYFGRAYDIDVVGLQGISTVSEFGLKDVQRLVDLIVARKIRAVFVESSIPKRSIEAVVEGARARGHDVRIGGTLFSDAMGQSGTPEGTYVGMVRSNVNTIVPALLGKTAER
ncbi:MAG: zinc ABC transporter substrate-binding protein [Deltaproteobacteria bacterium]|nr:zinc ABC transporter substrate-binding protein [Deltaproteobacteria bacterium]